MFCSISLGAKSPSVGLLEVRFNESPMCLFTPRYFLCTQLHVCSMELLNRMHYLCTPSMLLHIKLGKRGRFNSFFNWPSLSYVVDIPDRELNCVGFWMEDMRSYMITYDEEDAVSPYRCWVGISNESCFISRNDNKWSLSFNPCNRCWGVLWVRNKSRC